MLVKNLYKRECSVLFVYFLLMKKVVLIFPDTERMTDFIFSNKIFQAEVDSKEFSLTAFLPDNEIMKACTVYEAMLLIPG
jgi:hypothetical protein